MSQDTLEKIINHLNEKEMETFKTFSADKKANSIYKRFVGYYACFNKSSKAKNENERVRIDIDAERHFALATKQLRSLDQEERFVYLRLIKTKIEHAVKNNDKDRLVLTNMLFGTILRQIPNDLTSEEVVVFEEIKNLMDELTAQLEQ